MCSFAFADPGFAPQQNADPGYIDAYPVNRQLRRECLDQITVQFGNKLCGYFWRPQQGNALLIAEVGQIGDFMLPCRHNEAWRMIFNDISDMQHAVLYA
ncbi:hypothetical protein D3C87_1938010 [compost metagenome]